MSNEQTPEQPKEKRIKISTSYENEGKTFLFALESQHALHESDILAGLKQVSDHVAKVMVAKAEEAEKKAKSQLVDSSGAPISSKKKPRIVHS